MDVFTNKMADENYVYDDELELLGPLLLEDIPDFELKTEIIENVLLEEIDESDEELSQALQAIDEAQNELRNVGTVKTVADDVRQPTAQNSRFAKLHDDEKENIVMETESVATKRQTKYGVKIFKEWLKETKNDENFEAIAIEKLDSHLKDFYAEVRNANGDMYSKSTFVGIRASISRYLRAPPYNKTFSLMTDKEFHKSNQMFLAMMKKIKREGLDVTKHHPNITEGDLEKLRSSDIFNTNNPKGLLRKVWFDIMLGFGRRGRENQRSFTNKTFTVNTDDRGKKFVEMVVSETTKNHRGGLSDDDFERSPRIYANDTVKPGYLHPE